jgi:ABC-type nitrate/sulfonate/bicarbonate transport system permease component
MTVASPPTSSRSLGFSLLPAGLLRRAVRSLSLLLVSFGLVIALWWGFIKFANLSSFVAKNPFDVLHYLFGGAVDGTVVSGAEASANRHEIWGNLGTTAIDATFGYLAGTGIAVLVAMSVVMSRLVERTLMPVAIALRSVPLVAMTPLIALVFGRGLLAVTVIAGIVTFFPTLVNVVVGLRSAPSQAIDVVHAYGGNSWTIIRKVALLAALPSLFASARIAAPLALLGAVLAEWLATGKGLGALMSNSTTTSRYDTLWASVAVITVVSVLVYGVIALVESAVLNLLGQSTSTSS